jgi:hypothetical protein
VLSGAAPAATRVTNALIHSFHPLTAWCDNTDVSLAVMLRPGSAGGNTAADHIAIVDAAIAQIPAKYRRKMLFACDGRWGGEGTRCRAPGFRRPHTLTLSIIF